MKNYALSLSLGLLLPALSLNASGGEKESTEAVQSSEAAEPLAALSPRDRDREIEPILFSKGALAIGLDASYHRNGGKTIFDSATPDQLSTVNTTYMLQPCLSYWLSDQMVLNTGLSYANTVSTQRPNEDDRYHQGINQYGLMLGAEYFHPCFDRFGLSAGADLGFWMGSQFDRAVVGNDKITRKNNFWEFQPSGYIGAWYAKDRYLVSANLGLISFRHRNTRIEEDESPFTEPEYNIVDNDFFFGLNTKQFGLGLRYLLNANRSDNTDL